MTELEWLFLEVILTVGRDFLMVWRLVNSPISGGLEFCRDTFCLNIAGIQAITIPVLGVLGLGLSKASYYLTRPFPAMRATHDHIATYLGQDSSQKSLVVLTGFVVVLCLCYGAIKPRPTHLSLIRPGISYC
jgi:hypothetical protein